MKIDIELRQIRYFMAVAQELKRVIGFLCKSGFWEREIRCSSRSNHDFEITPELNFTRAAEKLSIAQPPLSRQIQSLEKELGVQLLNRTNKRVTLTPAGTAFYRECRQILQTVENGVQVARQVAQGKIGRIVMGFEGSTYSEILLRIIRKFHESYPGVELVLQEMASGKQVKALKEKQIAVGLLDPIMVTPDLEFKGLFSESLVAVVPEKHPLADAKTIYLGDLSRDLWVTGRNDGTCGLLQRLLDVCKEYNFVPQIRQEANDIQMMLSFVASGFGVTLLPESNRSLVTPGVRFLPLQDPVPEIQMAIAWLYEAEPSPIRQSLLNTIQTISFS